MATMEGQQMLEEGRALLEKRSEDDREFIALFATDEKVTHTQVANLRQETPSMVGRRLRRIRDAFFEWSASKQETSSSVQ